MAYLGWPYSFAAGNYNGPTYGVAVDYDSRNDAHVFGFDCSGLALYAWAPYIHMDHYAATQYNQAGHVHPNVASLMPGDLVFWSDDGTVVRHRPRGHLHRRRQRDPGARTAERSSRSPRSTRSSPATTARPAR